MRGWRERPLRERAAARQPKSPRQGGVWLPSTWLRTARSPLRTPARSYATSVLASGDHIQVERRRARDFTEFLPTGALSIQRDPVRRESEKQTSSLRRTHEVRGPDLRRRERDGRALRGRAEGRLR